MASEHAVRQAPPQAMPASAPDHLGETRPGGRPAADPGTVYLYDGIGQSWFGVSVVRDFLAAWLPWLRTEVRGDLLGWALDEIGQEACRAATRAGLAEKLCRTRAVGPAQEVTATPRRVLKPEAEFESRVLAGAVRAVPGVVYDGTELQLMAFDMLARGERGPGAIHIWFTERLLATWDEAGRRYHARVSLYGLPSIVSSSGMVEAPARERGHYLARRLGLSPDGAEAADPSGHLRYEDPRTAEAAKGYAMQAVFYSLTGEPFCDDPCCRLFNAHWQRELLAAQLSGSGFCPRHREMLQAWRAGWSDWEVRAS